MTGRVVAFGEVMLRLKAPGFERLLQSPLLEATFGGGEANVSVSLAQFGQAVTYVTALPRNPIGEAFDWAARVMAVSLEMFLPGLAGQWLDRRLGTTFLTLLGFTFGLVAGVWHLLLMTRKTGRSRDRNDV